MPTVDTSSSMLATNSTKRPKKGYPVQQQSNPFLPAPEYPARNPEISKAKKRQQLALPAIPRVPQPMGNAARSAVKYQVLGAVQYPAQQIL